MHYINYELYIIRLYIFESVCGKLTRMEFVLEQDLNCFT